MAPIRALVPVVATAALVLPAVAACSGTSSGGMTSTSVTPSVSASASASVPSVSATGTPGTPGTPSVDTSRLAAIATCLKNAGLPTPTSTNAAGAAVELLRLARDPATANALRQCGIPIPGGTTSSSTTSG